MPIPGLSSREDLRQQALLSELNHIMLQQEILTVRYEVQVELPIYAEKPQVLEAIREDLEKYKLAERILLQKLRELSSIIEPIGTHP